MYRTVVTICMAQWSLYVPHSGRYMYRTVVTICTDSLTFSNSTFYPHSVFMSFVWIWEQTAIVSLYSINWLVFVTVLTLYSPVVTICTTSLTFNNSTFCPHTVFMCFVWILEQTAIIYLYRINWLVFIFETECIYCAVWTGCLYIIKIINSYESLLESAHPYSKHKCLCDFKPPPQDFRQRRIFAQGISYLLSKNCG